MPSLCDGGGEERSAGKTDRTVMGPLDQARIRSRSFPAGRPHQARTTDHAEDSNQGRSGGRLRSQAWPAGVGRIITVA